MARGASAKLAPVLYVLLAGAYAAGYLFGAAAESPHPPWALLAGVVIGGVLWAVLVRLALRREPPAAPSYVYLVQGVCGHWSDADQWPVRAFWSARTARQFAEDAERWAAAELQAWQDAGEPLHDQRWLCDYEERCHARHEDFGRVPLRSGWRARFVVQAVEMEAGR